MTTYSAPITEAQGAVWNPAAFTTVVQKGAATFLIDGAMREVTTGATGAYSNSAGATSACPTTGSFRWTQTVRIDSATTECYPKLFFWGDGNFAGNTSARMENGYFLAFGPSEAVRFVRVVGAGTALSPTVPQPVFVAGGVWNVEIEGTPNADGTALLGARFWVSGGTRPSAAQVTTTEPAATGSRSGLFGYGVEAGNTVTPIQVAFGSLVVEPVGGVAAPVGSGFFTASGGAYVPMTVVI